MSELAFLLTILLAFAGMLALIAAYGVAAYFKRRNPVLYRRAVRPSITAAMEHDLLGRDNEPTRDILAGTPYVRGRPLYAIEAAPAPSRSRS